MGKHELEGTLRLGSQAVGGILIKYPRVVMENEGEWNEMGGTVAGWLWLYATEGKRIKLTLEVEDEAP